MTNHRCEKCGKLGGTYLGGELEWENGEMVRVVCIDKNACYMRRNMLPPLPVHEYQRLPDAGSIDYETFYNADREVDCERLAKVSCPWCGRTCSPLLSPYRIFQDAGWRWVGLDHQEPYTLWGGRCPDCHGWFRFLIFTPQ